MIHIKIRSDFVTNSSSSSFVALKIKSPMLAEIIKHFKKEISVGEFQYNPCSRFDVKKDIIKFEDEFCCDEPENLLGVLTSLIEIIASDFYVNLNKPESIDSIISELENKELNVSEKTALHIIKNRKEIIDDIESVKFDVTVSDYGGDGDSRFEFDSYDEDYLKELLKQIAEANDIPVEEVDEDVFADYVADMMSVEEISFRFDKSTGQTKIARKYRLEG